MKEKGKTMKKIVALIMSMILGMFLLTSCGEKKDESIPSGLKTASADTANYTFYIPEDWIVDISNAATSAHVSQSDPSNISVMAWQLEHTDSTVDEWWEVNIAELQEKFDDFEEISKNNVTLDGVYAVEYVYTAALSGVSHKFMQTAAAKGGELYVVTYSATADKFDSHIDEAKSIVSEFRFK